MQSVHQLQLLQLFVCTYVVEAVWNVLVVTIGCVVPVSAVSF